MRFTCTHWKTVDINYLAEVIPKVEIKNQIRQKDFHVPAITLQRGHPSTQVFFADTRQYTYPNTRRNHIAISIASNDNIRVDTCL